jgi:hypothetical protein
VADPLAAYWLLQAGGNDPDGSDETLKHTVAGPRTLGKKVLLAASIIDSVDLDEKKIRVTRSKEDIKSANQHDADRGIDDGYWNSTEAACPMPSIHLSPRESVPRSPETSGRALTAAFHATRARRRSSPNLRRAPPFVHASERCRLRESDARLGRCPRVCPAQALAAARGIAGRRPGGAATEQDRAVGRLVSASAAPRGRGAIPRGTATRGRTTARRPGGARARRRRARRRRASRRRAEPARRAGRPRRSR